MSGTILRCGLFVCFALISSFLFSAENGAALFSKNCAVCHGADGAGDTPARKKLAVIDLRDKEYVNMSDDAMFDTIGRGTKHKAYPHTYLLTGTSEQDIRSLVAHIRTLQKKSK